MKRNLIKVWQPSDLAQLELQRGFFVNRPVPRHWHEEYQFCLIETGTGSLSYRGEDYLTPPAGLFIVHPGEVHSNRAFEKIGCSFRTLFLEIGTMKKILAELQSKNKELPFFPSAVQFDKKTVQQFVRLHQSLERSASRLEREINLQEFLVGLITRFAENRLSPPSYKKERKKLEHACDYLMANYAENTSLERLASITNLSPFHFSRLFSEQFGMPPHAFQVQVRILQAKRFLREGMKISQAAFQTGFSDQSHFTRHFKRVIGITPGEYYLK